MMATATFTPEHRETLHQHSTHQHYDPSAIPISTRTLARSCPTRHRFILFLTRLLHGQQYGYGLVNEKPVIVDHSSRRIIQVSTDAIIASRLNPSVSEVVSGSKAPMVSTSVSTAKASAELEARLLTNATW